MYSYMCVDCQHGCICPALYHLAKHPEVQEKACKEVLSVVGRDGDIDDSALQKMPYIKACVKETGRCICVYICTCFIARSNV